MKLHLAPLFTIGLMSARCTWVCELRERHPSPPTSEDNISVMGRMKKQNKRVIYLPAVAGKRRYRYESGTKSIA